MVLGTPWKGETRQRARKGMGLVGHEPKDIDMSWPSMHDRAIYIRCWISIKEQRSVHVDAARSIRSTVQV